MAQSQEKTYRLGIDIGSTTAKAVIFDSEGQIVFHKYGKHNTFIYKALIDTIADAIQLLGDIPVSCAITGTAGMGISERHNIKFVQEVIAATTVL